MALTGNELQQLFCLLVTSLCLVAFGVLVWREPFCSRCRSSAAARLRGQAAPLQIVTPGRPLHPTVRVLGFCDAVAQVLYWIDPKTVRGRAFRSLVMRVAFARALVCPLASLIAHVALSCRRCGASSRCGSACS